MDGIVFLKPSYNLVFRKQRRKAVKFDENLKKQLLKESSAELVHFGNVYDVSVFF